MKLTTRTIIALVTVLVVFVVGGYYIAKLKSGGNRAASFVRLTYKWGMGDTLQNSYDSKSGDYQFIDQSEQLVKENFKLRTNNVIYLHSKINGQDLLNIPDTIANPGANVKDAKVLRYEFKFIYDDTTKNVIFLSNYDKDPVILNKATALQKAVQQVISEAEERFTKK